jgi:N-methylhydantoinase B
MKGAHTIDEARLGIMLNELRLPTIKTLCAFGGTGERFSHKPWGVLAVAMEKAAKFAILSEDGTEKRLPIKIPKVAVSPTEQIAMQTAGSGGYGMPEQRPPEFVEADRAIGKFSASSIKRNYGV